MICPPGSWPQSLLIVFDQDEQRYEDDGPIVCPACDAKDPDCETCGGTGLQDGWEQ